MSATLLPGENRPTYVSQLIQAEAVAKKKILDCSIAAAYVCTYLYVCSYDTYL